MLIFDFLGVEGVFDVVISLIIGEYLALRISCSVVDTIGKCEQTRSFIVLVRYVLKVFLHIIVEHGSGFIHSIVECRGIVRLKIVDKGNYLRHAF